MKKIICAVIAFIAVSVGIDGQSVKPRQPGATGRAAPAAGYIVGEQGPHDRVWQKLIATTNRLGQIVTVTNDAYVELATGLNYQDPNTGQWAESKEEIETFRGGAVARQGQHKVIFANNLATAGAIRLQMADGKELKSHVLGLSYYDNATGKSVLIAEVRDSQGRLYSPNVVVYPDAFTDFKADVCYTYTKAGFEQDIVLHEKPPLPEEYGLNSESTVLEVLTEFIAPPTPKARSMKTPWKGGRELEDQTLDFGAMAIGPGRVFLIGEDKLGGVPVCKQWTKMEGRTFLIEQVEIPAVAKQLDQLSLPAQVNLKPVNGSVRHVVSNKSRMLSRLPDVKVAGVDKGTMKVAEGPFPSKGLVLDYATLISSFTNYTFRGDTTYYISGATTFFGTNTFEGGTVIKYATNGAISMVLTSIPLRVNWLGSAYRPIVMTAKDDDSVGEMISGSTHVPTGYYANSALYLVAPSPTPTLAYFRVAYARQAFMCVGTSPTFSNGQLVYCQNGISFPGASVSLRNVLFANVRTNFNTIMGSLDAQNITINASDYLFTSQSSNSVTAVFTNCVFANLTNLYNLPNSLTGTSNGFYRSPVFGSGQTTNTFYPFWKVGGGNYYLTNGCTFFNQGTMNIDPNLQAGLKTKTTYPPVVYAQIALTNDLVLTPQIPRDTDAPDLGYHYDPLDYVVSGTYISGATLTVNPGTAIGTFATNGYTYGLGIGPNARFKCFGSADNLIRIAEYSTVQEQPGVNWGMPAYGSVTEAFTGAPLGIDCRFTDWSVLAMDIPHFFANNTVVINLQDCQFHSGLLESYYPTINFTNCLLERVYADLEPEDANIPHFRNNLVWNGTFGFFTFATNALIKDNLFDGPTIPDWIGGSGNTYDGGYNAYVTNFDRLHPTFASDVILSNSPAYQTGPLGRYYYPTTLTKLIDAGSVNDAGLVGLYHYTTTTNQVKEANSIVDIGFHYVALNSSGNPVDSNNDGIPDYLEDSNGNGQIDPGESPWLTPPAINTQPGGQNVIQGMNATFSVGANGSPPLSYQWQLNGGSISGANNPQLVVSSAQPADAGSYSVVVTNLAGSATSANAGLVVVPVSWMQQYFGVDYPNNPNAGLGADADGDGQSNVQEYVGGTDPTDFYNGILPNLAISSGNNQSGSLNAFLAQPLVAQVTTGGGSPINNAPVVFSVSTGLNQISSTSGGSVSTTLTSRTDSNGRATAWLFLPAGVPVNNNVTAKVQSGTSSDQIVFTETALTTDTPVISPNGGTFRTMQNVILSCQTAGAVIHYTLNGNVPTEADPSVASGQTVLVQGSATLSARVFKSGTLVPGGTASAVFTILGGVAAGGNFTIALKYNGSAWAAGTNKQGQLGDGTFLNRSNVVSVANLSSGVTAISGGGNHSLALLTDGTVRAWGTNNIGQLGDGTTITRNTNVVVTNLTSVFAIAAGGFHSLALLSNGTVRAWGTNAYGQLGDGTTIQRLTNVLVVQLSNVTAVAAGNWHSLALLTDGTVRAWGTNMNGQLGNGTTLKQLTNVVVTNLSSVIAIATKGSHSLALLSNGTVRAWGLNANGQLGDGTTTQRTTNVVVTNLTSVMAIAAGASHSLALLSNGTVRAWGLNSSGQLGDGTTTQRTTNVLVSGLSNVVAIAAGASHSVALKSDGTVWVWGLTNYGLPGPFSTVPVLREPSVHLIYWAAPSILTQPQNQTVILGQSATFGVDAFGTLPMSYQWYSNSTPVAGATGTALTLYNAQTNFAANYFVVVSNILGSTTSGVATLTVIVPPSIITQPVSQTAVIGGSASFVVVAAGTGPLSYQWYGINSGLLSGATAATLAFANVQSANADNYYVVVSNAGGSVTSALAGLRIPPFFTAQPVPQTVAKGSTASFNVSVTGAPAPTYQWYGFNAGALPNQTGTALTLNNIQSSDTYFVVAVNGFGAVSSFPAQLTVTDPAVDADGNGLPDAWETLYFGHTSVDPAADPDGDGWTNLQEYLNGTNPNVADQPFKVLITLPANNFTIP